MKKIVATTLITFLLSSGGCLFSQTEDSIYVKAIKSIDLFTGAKGFTDPALAFKNLSELAEMGNPMAMNALGKAYMEALNCPADTAISFYWFKKAADAGYPTAWHNLGTIYKYGLFGIQDFALAFYYFDKLATTPSVSTAIGLYDVGYMLYKGLGVQSGLCKGS